MGRLPKRRNLLGVLVLTVISTLAYMFILSAKRDRPLLLNIKPEIVAMELSGHEESPLIASLQRDADVKQTVKSEIPSDKLNEWGIQLETNAVLPEDSALPTTQLGTNDLDPKKHPPSTCSPTLNIAFVKTHKAASSTITSILQRFGFTNNLNFALPNKTAHTYGYNYITKRGEPLTRDSIFPLHPDLGEYNILCNHAIYNRTAFREIMPENTAYITILREPFSQAVSTWEYYTLLKTFSRVNKDMLQEENPMSAYLENPLKYMRLGENVIFSEVKNKMSDDIGMGLAEYYIEDKLNDYFAQVEQDFALVMIMEYFDESLLLLKKKLCWTTKDIIYITKNINTHKQKRHFTSIDRERHKIISNMDYKLYDYFLQRFIRRPELLKPDFTAELANFRALLAVVKDGCEDHKTIHVHSTKWYDAFDISHFDCQFLRIPELVGLDFLIGRARTMLQGAIFSDKPPTAWQGSRARRKHRRG